MKLNLVTRNYRWWASSLSVGKKAAYYPSLLLAYVRLAITRDKRINYIGNRMQYDNPAVPLSLQHYPYELSETILRNLSSEIKNVLDIGGNIGQFSLTLSTLMDRRVNIDVMEPNREIFPMLVSNTASHKNIKCYNFGIGDPSVDALYYTPDKSAIGSIIPENASVDRRVVSKVEIELTNDVRSVTKRKKYDLIKIDVEGYEYDLLRAIKDLKTKYLFLEVSGLGRTKNYSHSRILQEVKNKFGEYDIINLTAANRESNHFDLLLEFRN